VLIVSASHPVPKWQLTKQPFLLVEAGEWSQSYRVGGDKEHGYYAIATGFGCGKTHKTPKDAIHSLLLDNGCRAIHIEEVL